VDAVAVIDRIIGEHKKIFQGLQTLEQEANDAMALKGLEKAKDTFMPGRLEQKEGLQDLEKLLETIDKGLRGHFSFEETYLLGAFEKHSDKKLISVLHSLLLEHEDIRNRLAHSKEHIAELIKGELSRHVWEASAHDMRAHLAHTRKLIEAHAAIEQELLHSLRKELMRNRRKKE